MEVGLSLSPSLSLLQTVDLLGKGPATQGLLLQSAQFFTSSTLSRKSSMLYLMTSIHLFLFPLFCCPRTSASKNSLDTILLFSTLYMPKPSQPGFPYLVRDACYSEDATDVIISVLVLKDQGSIVTFSFQFFPSGGTPLKLTNHSSNRFSNHYILSPSISALVGCYIQQALRGVSLYLLGWSATVRVNNIVDCIAMHCPGVLYTYR